MSYHRVNSLEKVCRLFSRSTSLALFGCNSYTGVMYRRCTVYSVVRLRRHV
jgi:hypothetical protein